jgi:hypothetical protein
MRLTEFSKAIGKAKGQEAGPTFEKSVWAEADFASHCSATDCSATNYSATVRPRQVYDEMMKSDVL